jgi:hypothetical protein
MQTDPHSTAPRLTPLTPSSFPKPPAPPQNPLATTLSCSACSKEKPSRDLVLDRLTGAPKEPLICWKCWEKAQYDLRIQEEAKKILDDLGPWVVRNLCRLGMSAREAKAELARVPDAIKGVLPKEATRTLARGDVPTAGFGLGGNTDGGKTMALAALIKAHVASWARREIPKQGEVQPDWLCWACWPDEVLWLRSHAIDPAAPARVDHLSTVDLLILDDLGRERIKGSYSDDWAASQLDAIVNARYREERVTIWTTNVEETDLVNLYGAALLRRLTADNPLVWIPDLRSAR